MAGETISQAIVRLKVSDKTLRRWLRAGCPHSRDERGAYKVDVDAVRRWRAARVAAAYGSSAGAGEPEELGNVDQQEEADSATEAHVSAAVVHAEEAEWTADEDEDSLEITEADEAVASRHETMPDVRTFARRWRERRFDPMVPESDAPARPKRGASSESGAAAGASAELPDEDAAALASPRDALTVERERIAGEIAAVASPRSRGGTQRIRFDGALAAATRSVVILRVPQKPGEAGLLGANEVRVSHSVVGRALQDFCAQGGPIPYIERHLGPGSYCVMWCGDSGTSLHTEEIEVPDLNAAFRRLKAAQDDVLHAEHRARQQRERERVRAQEERRAAEARERWVQHVTATALLEATRRSPHGCDVVQLRARIVEHLRARVAELAHLRAYDPAICWALEPFLPRLPAGDFAPWLPVVPEPPPPPPPPEVAWTTAWADYAAEQAARRGLAPSAVDRLRPRVAAYLWRNREEFGLLPLGHPALVAELNRIFGRRRPPWARR